MIQRLGGLKNERDLRTVPSSSKDTKPISELDGRRRTVGGRREEDGSLRSD